MATAYRMAKLSDALTYKYFNKSAHTLVYNDIIKDINTLKKYAELTGVEWYELAKDAIIRTDSWETWGYLVEEHGKDLYNFIVWE